MDTHKRFDVLSAGIATWDTLLLGVDSDLMDHDAVMAKDTVSASGGDAVNAAISMARLGLRVTVCACTGVDPAAEMIKEDLKKAGADTSFLYQDEKIHTAAPVLLVDEHGDRHIIRIPDNGNLFFTEEMVPDEALEASRHLHLASTNVLRSLDGKPLGRLFKRAREKGLTTSLDASYDSQGRWMENLKEVIGYCDIFIPSFQEASIYAGSEDLEEICAFFSKYLLQVFGIKLGEKGVLVTDFKKTYQLPTLYEGKPVDTTGAGDAFLAGFVSAWLRDYDLASSAYLGAAQSASVLRSAGANVSAGTMEDALELIGKRGIVLHRRGAGNE